LAQQNIKQRKYYLKIFKLLIGLFFFGLTSIASANQDVIWSLGAGASYPTHAPKSPFIISEWVSDDFHQATQQLMPSFTIDVKKIIPLQNSALLTNLHIGPAVYFDIIKSTGDVWELNQPQFDNYSDKLVVKQAAIFAEAEGYLKPLCQSLTPFLLAGLGASVYTLNYDDWAKGAIPLDSELHLNAHHGVNFAYALGAGITHAINENASIYIKYRFQDAGVAHSALASNLISPIQMDAISHQVFLGVQYRAAA